MGEEKAIYDAETGEVQEQELSLVPIGQVNMLSIDQAEERYTLMREFIKRQLKDGNDFGTIPGTSKDTLYKPGAEKLLTLFNYRVTFTNERDIENWDDQDPLFYYSEKCHIWSGDVLVAEASGSANSKENRYRWRWIGEDELPAGFDKKNATKRGGKEGVFRWQYDKRETSGKYGKPESYWKRFDDAIQNGTIEEFDKEQFWNKEMKPYYQIEAYEYRIPNDEIFTLVNTIRKMAQKRALVAATLIACNASDYFTQDLEDIGDVTGHQVDEPSNKKAKQAAPKDGECLCGVTDKAPGSHHRNDCPAYQ